MRQLLALPALLLGSISFADQPAYHMEILGPIDGGHNFGTPENPLYQGTTSVANDAGQVAGWSDSRVADVYGQTAWLFDGEEVHHIGLVDPAHTDPVSGQTDSWPRYINGSGQVAGRAAQFGAAGSHTAWVYTDGETIAIGPSGGAYNLAPGSAYGGYSESMGISDAGEVVGRAFLYTEEGTQNGETTWIWDGATTYQIGYFTGDYVREDGFISNKLYSRNGYSMSPNGVVAGASKRFDYAGSGSLLHSEITWRWDNGARRKVGFYNNAHTTTSGYQKSKVTALSPNGIVGGRSAVFATNDLAKGQSAWIDDGATVQVGLYADEHLSSRNYRYSYVANINEAGYATGYSYRYDGTSQRGQTAWIYNGSESVIVGLLDGEHLKSDGTRLSTAYHVNSSGQTAGQSDRYSETDGNLGYNYWFFDGTSTVLIGLTDADHTRVDGYRRGGVRNVFDNGTVLGNNWRYDAISTSSRGEDYWVYDGTSTVTVSLTGSEFTSSSGTRDVAISDVNDAGQVIGWNYRYQPGTTTTAGWSAWFWNGTESIELVSGNVSAGGIKYARAFYLGEDGTVLGWFRKYDDGGEGEITPFKYTDAGGFEELAFDLSVDLAGLPFEILPENSVAITDRGVISANVSSGGGYFPVSLTTEPVATVEIDVDPASPLNEIDPESTGQISVAVKTTSVSDGDSSDFDATQINDVTLEFGPGNANLAAVPTYTDIDGDSDTDAVFAFDIPDSGIACEDTEVNLWGETFASEQFEGVDSITTDCDTGCHP